MTCPGLFSIKEVLRVPHQACGLAEGWIDAAATPELQQKKERPMLRQ